MKVICGFPAQGATLQEQLIRLLRGRKREDEKEWTGRK